MEVVKGYSSVGINSSLCSQAEDILYRLKRWSHLKLPKQRYLLFPCALKPEVENLLGGRMDLTVIVSSNFMGKHPVGLPDIGHILPHTGLYEPVLKPAIGPLIRTLGLGR